ncbi:MAG: hypothetical protein MUC76_14910 [Spirochaetes bacterium]|jgi:hypothetical protein|nr:hypothetical protein [Spirochaetota bacterium]
MTSDKTAGGDRLDEIKKELEDKRARWRAVRSERLAVKARLEGDGLDRSAVRKDKRHRELEKRQERLTTLIRHIEKRLNRAMARAAKGDGLPVVFIALLLSGLYVL